MSKLFLKGILILEDFEILCFFKEEDNKRIMFNQPKSIDNYFLLNSLEDLGFTIDTEFAKAFEKDEYNEFLKYNEEEK